MRRGLQGACAALVLVLAGAIVAPPVGAQAQEFSCRYEVGPTVLPPGGGFITVEGTAPGSSIVRVFLDGAQAAVTTAAPGSGFFSVDLFVTRSVEIAVAVDDYPNTPCSGVGGSGTGRGRGTVTVGGGGAAGSGQLAGTGASSTGRFVLIGLAAIVLGAAFVVATRRRDGVRGRS